MVKRISNDKCVKGVVIKVTDGFTLDMFVRSICILLKEGGLK